MHCSSLGIEVLKDHLSTRMQNEAVLYSHRSYLTSVGVVGNFVRTVAADATTR